MNLYVFQKIREEVLDENGKKLKSEADEAFEAD